jgi:hypothetical protein
MGGTMVDLNSRYNAAWFEVNTRLTLRQNTITVYAALMSFVVAGMGLPVKSPIAQSVILLVPVWSVLFALLVVMHDKIIINLCKFIRHCETFGNTGTPPFPCYLQDKNWSGDDTLVRKYHHYVCAVLIVVFNGLAFLTAMDTHPELFAFNSAVMWSLVAFALISVGLALRTVRLTE